MAIPARCSVRLQLFGCFRLAGDDGVVHLPPGAQRVLTYVALNGPIVTRAVTAGVLWPSAGEHEAQHNLRSALWRIHRTGIPSVESDGESLRLSPLVAVDVDEMTETAGRVLDPVASCEERSLHVDFSSALLPGWYEDWVLVHRRRLDVLRVQALEALAERRMRAGRLAEAEAAALTAVSVDPFRESAVRALIDALRAEGNNGDALRAFRTFRSLLARELGTEPSTELQASVRALAAGVR